MSREKNLLKNTIIIVLGKIFTQLITFLLLPLYTGILSTSEFGIVDLLNTLVYLLLPLVTFQIENGLFRGLIDSRDNLDKNKYLISSSIYSIIIQCFLFLFLFLIISPFIHNSYKWYLVINVIVYIFSSLFLQIARGLGNNVHYSIGCFLSALSTIIFNILFLVIFKMGASGMLLASMIGQIFCILYEFIFLKLFNYLSISYFDKAVLFKLLKYSIPLIPNAISWWIFNASDRVIVSTFLGVDQNGILAASLKFSTVYITLYNFFNMSWTESISVAIKDEDLQSYFNKMFNIVISLFIAMCLGAISLMPFIYPIMINGKFGDGYVLVPISLLASLFNVVVGLISVIYVGMKNTKAIANTSVISAIINIIVHLSLIHFIGLYAAVISTLTSFFIMSIYRIFDINKKYINIKFNKGIIIKTIIVLPFILYCYYCNNFYLNIISIIVSIIFAFLINKDSLNIVFDYLKKRHLKR